MRYLKFLSVFFLGSVISACTPEPEIQPENAIPVDAQQHIQQAEQEIAEAEVEVAAFESDWISPRMTVTVPAGSVDALADAIAEAGPGGTVILETGEHVESAPVVIEQRVKIEGEDGALLLFPNALEPQGIPMEVRASLHIRNTSRVWLKNFGLLTGIDQAGRIGVQIQNAPRTRLESLHITSFQYGVLLDGGNRCQFIDNTLVGIYADYPNIANWGLTNSTGQRSIMMRNTISGFAVGVFFSDRNSLAFSNTLIGMDIGMLWCTVAPWQAYPDGTVIAAAEPARGCRAYNNLAVANLWSYLVIDGARSSVLIQNESVEPVLYDIELAPASERFGFPTPTSTNSLVISVGNYIDYSIKDCTGDNTIIGGVLVDTDVDICF